MRTDKVVRGKARARREQKHAGLQGIWLVTRLVRGTRYEVELRGWVRPDWKHQPLPATE